MTELELYLNSYFGISENSLNALARLFNTTTLSKNDFYCEAGKACKQLSFIKTGSLRVYAYSDGKDVTQWISSKGEFVTDLSSLVFGTSARWNIQALTACEFNTIKREDYLNIKNLVPEWPELEKRFLSNCFMTLEDRVLAFFLCQQRSVTSPLFLRK